MASSVSFKRRPADSAAPAPAPTNVAPATVPTPLRAVTPEATLAAAQEPTPPPASPPAQAPVSVPAPAPAPSTAVATQDTRVATDDQYNGVGGFEGEWNARDMATPYLSIVGKTSKAFDTHPDWMGQFLYDKDYPLGTEIRVVFIRATKWFVEDLPFGGTQIPQRFARMADARAAGFNESTLKDTAELDLLRSRPHRRR